MKLKINPEMLDGEYIENLIDKHPETIGMQFDAPQDRNCVPVKIIHNMEEIRPYGGLKHKGGRGLTDRYEQLYADRALFRVIDSCQARCKNCYIKNQIGIPKHLTPDLEGKLVASPDEINEVLSEVRSQLNLRNFLISGGTPFILTVDSLDYLVQKFLEIPHIKQLYLAGSRPIFNPKMFSEELAEMLSHHIKYNKKLEENKRVGVTFHINHPDELQPEVITGLNNFSKKGIPLFSQTILMRGLNDSPEILERLYSNLASIGVKPYYLLHAMPTTFAKFFRTSVQRGLELMHHLERNSGHERALFTIASKAGKVHLTSSTDLQYEEKEGKRYVVLKTPHKKEDFLRNLGINELPRDTFERDGIVYVNYLDGEQ